MAPPSAIDIERVLLGAALLGATTLLTVAEILPPGRGQWFYLDAHQYIYDAMATLTERNDAIDMETETDVLRRRGNLEKIGGSVYLAELMEGFVTTANIAHHARIVRDKALYRGMINLASDLSASAYAQDDLPALVHRAQDALFSIAGAQQTAAFATLYTLVRDTIREAQHTHEGDLTGVHTGFHRLNDLTSGFQHGNLIIVAARPSMGKSALAFQLAMAAAQALEGLPVCIFSLEMSREELGLRLLCSEARVNAQRLKRGVCGQEEWALIWQASARIENVPILVDDTSSLSVLDVRTRATRVQMEHGLGMVIVDYLQLMSSAGKRKESRQQEISDISRDLKILAKDLNVPVIALAQLSREVEHRSPPVPVLSDCRDSGAIEQDADMVLFIYRGDIHEHDNPDVGAKLIIAKQRNGPTGEVKLVFNSTFARFDDRADAHQERLAQVRIA